MTDYIKKLDNVTIYRDLGAFGDGKWQKHLTVCAWYDNDPKYDIRSWNEDMTKYGKGVTLDSSELFDLLSLIEDALEGEEDSDV